MTPAEESARTAASKRSGRFGWVSHSSCRLHRALQGQGSDGLFVRLIAMEDGWPLHVLAAGVLVWSVDGTLLMVQTHNRDYLILPGGLIEVGESPTEGARREVQEEVGLTVEIGSLLAVQHVVTSEGGPSSVQFVFDSRPLHRDPVLSLQREEIVGAFWLSPEEAIGRTSPAGATRLASAFEMLETSAGIPVGSSPPQ